MQGCFFKKYPCKNIPILENPVNFLQKGMDISREIMYNRFVLIFSQTQKEAFSDMKLFKRAAAALLAVTTAFGCVSCGESTAYAITIDGYDIRAGVYLYYVTNAYNDAIQVLRDGGETFEGAETTADYKKILKNVDIDGKKADVWIQDKAVDYCTNFVQIEKDFDRLELTLSGQELSAVNNGAASSMSTFGEFFTQTGIGEQSVRDILANSYKQEALWEAYCGEGGSKGIEEQTLYDNYYNNHVRIKYITMPLKDGEGNLLKADGKAEIEKMAKDYLARLKKKEGDEVALMKEFDFLIEEHNHYVTSLSEAAVTTTDEDGNTITTPTTPKVTTDKNGSTGETTAETTAPEDTDTTAKTTTKAKDKDKDTETETTKAADTTEATDTTETTADTTETYEKVNDAEKETKAAKETTETTADTTAADETETTAETKKDDKKADKTEATETTDTTKADKKGDTTETTAAVTTEGTDTTTAETTTTEVTGLGYDTVNERILEISTSASEKDDADPTETTTAPTYTPCEKVYKIDN